MDTNIISLAVKEAGGPAPVSRAVGKSYQAVLKWVVNGRLPRTEYTGETNYAAVIASMQDKYTVSDLLSARRGAA